MLICAIGFLDLFHARPFGKAERGIMLLAISWLAAAVCWLR